MPYYPPTGLSGYSGFSGLSGYSGFCGLSGYSGFCGLSGYSGYSGSGISGYSGYSGSGLSGYSGFSGKSGYSGFCGLSGYSGYSSTSGYSGYSGPSGYSGYCGLSGYSGYSGPSGYSGYCGLSGYSGFSGPSGYSGFCGLSGYSGFSGANPGASGYSGYSGVPPPGTYVFNYDSSSTADSNPGDGKFRFNNVNSDLATAIYLGNNDLNGFNLDAWSIYIAQGPVNGAFKGAVYLNDVKLNNVPLQYYVGDSVSGAGYWKLTGLQANVQGNTYVNGSPVSFYFTPNGTSGFSGYSGISGFSGYSGFSGKSGYSGYSGPSGYSGYSGPSGYSGFCGLSGYSGYSGSGISGYSGYSGVSGYSGYSGPTLLTFTTQTDTDYTLALADANTGVKMSSSAAHNLTVPPNSSVAFTIGTQIVIEQAGTGQVTIAPGAGVTLQGVTLVTSGQYATVVLIKQATDTWLVGTGNSGYSGYSGKSGYSGYSGISGYSGFTGPTGPAMTVSYVVNADLYGDVGIILSKTGTITGTAGFGSSLFLERTIVPGVMNLSEIDAAINLVFNATSQGAGTISRAMAIYSFGNSTSLASVMSFSSSSVWSTGTSTTAGAASLTQFQGGWNPPANAIAYIQPMTFNSTSLAAGEYVIGQLFDFAQGSSTWTVMFAGQNILQSSIGTNYSLAAASGITGALGVSSYASSIIPMQWSGENSASGLTAFTLSPQTTSGTIASGLTASVLMSGSGTVKSSATLWSLVGASSNSNLVSSVSLGVSAGSIITNTQATTIWMQPVLFQYGFVGTGTNSSGTSQFRRGTMSTGAIPTTIALTSTAVTATGAVSKIPWFALVGS